MLIHCSNRYNDMSQGHLQHYMQAGLRTTLWIGSHTQPSLRQRGVFHQLSLCACLLGFKATAIETDHHMSMLHIITLYTPNLPTNPWHWYRNMWWGEHTQYLTSTIVCLEPTHIYWCGSSVNGEYQHRLQPLPLTG